MPQISYDKASNKNSIKPTNDGSRASDIAMGIILLSVGVGILVLCYDLAISSGGSFIISVGIFLAGFRYLGKGMVGS